MTEMSENVEVNFTIEEEDLNFDDLFGATNLNMLKLQAIVAASAVIIIAMIQILRLVTFMIVL